MAIEVSKQSQLYTKKWFIIPEKDTKEALEEALRKAKEAMSSFYKDTKLSGGIYYNYIHDLESVWWIGVWSLFNFKKKHSRTDETDSLAANQNKLHNYILFSAPIDDKSGEYFFS